MTDTTIADTAPRVYSHIPKLAAFDALVARLRTLDNSATSECGFDMKYSATWRGMSGHPCGSAACIGGHAALMLGDDDMCPEDAFEELTGVSMDDADKICYPEDGGKGWDADNIQAANLLAHYRETGVVDWDRAMGVMG